MLGAIYNEILYRPIFNLLVFLYNKITFHDLGLSVIIVTIIVNILIYPLTKKAIQSQKEMSQLQPKLKEVQEKFKGDKAAMNQEVLALYKTHNVNPFTSILLLFIQFPILIALYQIARNGFSPDKYPQLYSFISHPGVLNNISAGFLNIQANHNIIMALFVAGSQYYQTKLVIDRAATPKFKPEAKKGQDTATDIANIVNKQMLFMMPVFIGFLAYTSPTILAIYWITSAAVRIAQELILIQEHKL